MLPVVVCLLSHSVIINNFFMKTATVSVSYSIHKQSEGCCSISVIYADGG
jgi:hypothetical protein